MLPGITVITATVLLNGVLRQFLLLLIQRSTPGLTDLIPGHLKEFCHSRSKSADGLRQSCTTYQPLGDTRGPVGHLRLAPLRNKIQENE